MIEELKACAESADWAKAEKLAHWLAQTLSDRDRRIAAYDAAARKFIEKVESGRAHSKETYADLKDCLRGTP